MRRFFMGLAIASLTVASPIAAQAGDREIADTIVQTLKDRQTNGSLKDFDIDLAVENGVVTLTGKVANAQQATAVVEASRATAGVVEIINEIEVRKSIDPAVAASEESFVIPASGEAEMAEPPAMQELARGVAPDDAKITDSILAQLASIKNEGALRNFELDVSTVRGEVWTRGYVSTPEQKQLVLSTIQHVTGVTKIVDDINLLSTPGQPTSPVQQVSDSRVVGTSMPVVGQPGVPQAFAQSQLTSFQGDMGSDPSCVAPMGAPMGGMGGGPVPISGGPSYGPGVPRYDNPQAPNYAWPSYAAYPNYSAVTYPKQYSASAWPYIGPFYPYPQVPLGWRKVSLEWDDGLWYLDFSHKSGR